MEDVSKLIERLLLFRTLAPAGVAREAADAIAFQQRVIKEQIALIDAANERASKAWQARERAREALGKLERASSEVARYGAQTGSQWTHLSSALIAARAALAQGESK